MEGHIGRIFLKMERGRLMDKTSISCCRRNAVIKDGGKFMA